MIWPADHHDDAEEEDREHAKEKEDRSIQTIEIKRPTSVETMKHWRRFKNTLKTHRRDPEHKRENEHEECERQTDNINLGKIR